MQIKFHFALCFVLLSFSPALFALGLGGAEVRSFLNQPLNARIELISQSQEELNSVIAGLASAADFEIIGLSRTVSVPLRFEVNADLANAFITVTSRLPISDPVVQLVVKVTWSGGRMLREYNLFLDPPTFAARAPGPLVISRPTPAPIIERAEQSKPATPAPGKTRVAQTRQQDVQPEVDKNPDNATVIDAEPAMDSATEPVAMPEAAMAPDEQPVLEQAETLKRAARQTVTVPDEPIYTAPVETQTDRHESTDSPIEPSQVEQVQAEQVQAEVLPVEEASGDSLLADASTRDSLAEPEDSEEVSTEVAPATAAAEAMTQAETGIVADQRTTTQRSEPEPGFDERAVAVDSITATIGPVQRGQTLWGIATDYSRGNNYSINQAMLAIQRLNPDAFGHNNINFLNQGAILRMPVLSEVTRLSGRQAMLEAMRQETAHRDRRAGLPFDSSLPVIADSGIEKPLDSAGERMALQDVDTGEDQGLLELVPPSLGEETGDSGTGSGALPTGALSTQEVREVLARTEEELANAQQENSYLNERIRELEEKIAQSQADGKLADRELAQMEANLRENRLADEAEQPIVVIPLRQDKPWYAGMTGWFAGGLLLLLAAVIWLLKRRSSGNDHDPDPVANRDIDSAAEDDSQSLKTAGKRATGENNVIDLEDYVDSDTRGETSTAEQGAENGKSGQAQKSGIVTTNEEEAIEPDVSDHEIKLDLARAYISMNDHDAARQMLKEVIEAGNDAQVREAQEMMGEL